VGKLVEIDGKVAAGRASQVSQSNSSSTFLS